MSNPSDDAPTVGLRLTERQSARRQGMIGAAAGVACAALLAAAQLSGAFQGFDLRLLDWRFRLRGERPASDRIALVAIDDATIRAFGGWPLPREQYALLIETLEDAGARAIGIDLQLPDDANHDPRQNELLAFVSGRHTNVVHAVSFQSGSPGRGAASPPAASLEALRAQGVADAGVRAAEAATALLPYADLAQQARAIAHITVSADPDGAIRRLPPVVRYRDRLIAAMGLRMVGVGAGNAEPPRVAAEPGGVRVGWSGADSWRLPLDEEGALSLDFAGDRRSFPNATSMIEILREARAGAGERLRAQFSGRYVMVGLDSRTEVSEDVGTTPFAASTPLVFIHANCIDGFLRHRFLTRVPVAIRIAALAVLAGLLGAGLAAIPLALAAPAAAVAALVLAIMDQALFALGAVDLPPFALLLMPAGVYAAVASARFLFLERREREREADIRAGRTIEQQFLPEAMLGRQLSRYQVIEKLGSGGMGIVYRGRDARLKRDVALKVLPARALADESTRRRFRREAVALSRLHHPRIAAIFDFDSQDGTDFLVMEYVSGESLAARIRRGALPEPELLRVAGQVLEALQEAHARGIVHRDLKPENVMIAKGGDVKVLDFGVAMFLDGHGPETGSQPLTEAGHMVGTLPYMAPEVLRGERAEPRSDLYSLGVMMFEMATGRRPFPNDEPHELMYTVLNQPPPEPRILNGRISPFLDSLILRMLSKTVEQRPSSAAGLLAQLDAGARPGSPGAV